VRQPHARLLYGTSRSAASAQYNPIYEFGCTIQGQACDMRFTSISGASRQHGAAFPPRLSLCALPPVPTPARPAQAT